MSNARNLANLLGSTGDVKTAHLGNAPAPTKASIDALGIAATSLTGSQASAITANTSKTGITSGQASAITASSAKTTNYNQTKSDIDALSIAATSVTGSQATAITANTAKITYPSADSTKLSGIATSANNYSHPANHAISVTTGLQAALDGKTTESYVDSQITTLIGGAPSTLNDLNELAAAINDDAAYASTLTTALGTKVAKTSNQALSTAANAMTISGHTITLNRGDSTTDTVTVPDNNTTYSVGDGGLTQKNFTTADNTKLDGIETGATADQTGSQILALFSNSITAGHIAAGGVGASEIGNDVVNSQHYAAGSIDNEHIADNAINSEHYADGSIDLAHLSTAIGDMRRGVTYIGRDTNDYIEINTTMIRFYINGVRVMSLDASGNAIFKGNVTAYGTPA